MDSPTQGDTNIMLGDLHHMLTVPALTRSYLPTYILMTTVILFCLATVVCVSSNKSMPIGIFYMRETLNHYSCLPLKMGNIAERLLREGFARCVDWSMAMVSKEKEKLRAAEM